MTDYNPEFMESKQTFEIGLPGNTFKFMTRWTGMTIQAENDTEAKDKAKLVHPNATVRKTR